MSKNPLHIYRASLRESSYLALPPSRLYIRQHVISSFRRYIPHHKDSTWPPPELIDREAQLLRRARKFLYLLSRANAGYIGPFESILKLTFGRKGKRRRQLMSELMHPDSTEDTQDSRDALIARYGKPWKPHSGILSLLASQHARTSHLTYTSVKINPHGPSLPAKNIWGKPMPRCRVKNAWEKWYATYTDRLYPPLPEKEWKEIEAIAKGEKAVDVPPRRRKASVPVFADEEGEAIESILDEPKKTGKETSDIGHPHRITQRFIQKRMQGVLTHTPLAHTPTQPGKPALYEWGRSSYGTGIRIREASSDNQAEALFG
jgi:hypothetical protein